MTIQLQLHFRAQCQCGELVEFWSDAYSTDTDPTVTPRDIPEGWRYVTDTRLGHVECYSPHTGACHYVGRCGKSVKTRYLTMGCLPYHDCTRRKDHFGDCE